MKSRHFLFRHCWGLHCHNPGNLGEMNKHAPDCIQFWVPHTPLRKGQGETNEELLTFVLR